MAAQPPADTPSLPFPLQDNEQVIVLCRKHWWFLWPRTILWTLFAVVPVAVAVWLLSMLDILDDIGIFFLIVAVLWLLYWTARLLLNWYHYHNDIWVVTNQRIVDSLKPLPFQLRITTADLVNIQDMTVEKHGVIASLLNFGDVKCETAGSTQQIRIVGIPDPADLQLLVDKERDRERMRGAS